MQQDLQIMDSSALECPVCFGIHNDEIHQASLSIRSWFREDVLRRMEQPADLTPIC